jgi:hypothetical protein
MLSSPGADETKVFESPVAHQLRVVTASLAPLQARFISLREMLAMAESSSRSSGSPTSTRSDDLSDACSASDESGQAPVEDGEPRS